MVTWSHLVLTWQRDRRHVYTWSPVKLDAGFTVECCSQHVLTSIKYLYGYHLLIPCISVFPVLDWSVVKSYMHWWNNEIGLIFCCFAVTAHAIGSANGGAICSIFTIHSDIRGSSLQHRRCLLNPQRNVKTTNLFKMEVLSHTPPVFLLKTIGIRHLKKALWKLCERRRLSGANKWIPPLSLSLSEEAASL